MLPQQQALTFSKSNQKNVKTMPKAKPDKKNGKEKTPSGKKKNKSCWVQK